MVKIISFTFNSKQKITDGRRFVQKVLWFLPLIFAFAHAEYCVSLLPNTYNLKKSKLLDQRDSIELLSFGSSHGYFGFNPEKITCLKGLNLANTSQSLILDTKLLNEFRGQLPQLRVVLFFIDYFSLEYLMSDGPEATRNGFYVRYFGISETWRGWLEPKSYSVMASYGKEKTEQYFRQGIKPETNNKLSDSGWYRNIEDGMASGGLSENVAQGRVYYHDSIMKYENRAPIVEALENAIGGLDANTTVYFVISPTFRTYRQYMNAEKWNWTLKSLQSFSVSHKNVKLIASLDNHFGERDFGNSDHLNVEGANKLSSLLNSVVCPSHVQSAFQTM